MNHVLGGVPDLPRAGENFGGCTPPLKCIRLCKYQAPAAARGCRLVRRGQRVTAKARLQIGLTRRGGDKF